MAHDHGIELRLRSQELGGPGRVDEGSIAKSGFVGGVVSEVRTQPFHEAKADLGMDRAIDGCGDGVVDQPVQQRGPQARLAETVPMDRRESSGTHVKVEAARVESESGLPLPEVATPAVVVSADHEYGQPARRGEPARRRRGIPSAG